MLLDANPAAERLTGRSREEILSLHQSQLHPVNSPVKEDFISHVQAGLARVTHPATEVPVLHADGHEIMTEITTGVLELNGKQVIQGIFRDISARKQTNKQLSETSSQLSLSLSLLKGVLESVPIRVFWKDRDLRFLGCNTLFAKDAGLTSPDDLIGKTDFDMNWKGQALLYQEDDLKVIESGIPELGYEEPQTTPEGKIIWLRTSKVPLRNDSLDVIGILGIYDDITAQKKTEKNLLRSESRLKEAQAVAHFGSWEMDLIKNDLWWSDENHRIFGIEPGEKNTYETFLNVVHPEDREYVNQAYTTSLKNQTPYDIEHRLLMTDGSVKWVHEHCKTFYADNGKPLRSSGTTLDITKRKRTEAQASRLGRILNTSINEIYVFDASSLKFTLVNESALHNLGYSMEELSEMTPLDLKPEFIAEAFETVIAPLREDTSKVTVYETMHRRKDGSEYPIEVHQHYSALEVPPVFVATILDITERHKADDRLRHSEAGLAEAQRLAHLGNWELDITNNTLKWSDEIYRIFEIEPQKFGASYEAFIAAVHPDDRERLDHAYKESVKSKRPFDITHRLLIQDGQIKYVREMCETFYDENDHALRSLGTVQDITEQYLTAQALRHSNHALKALSSCNSVLVHASNEADILNNMCDVIINEGGYRFVWIGMVENDDSKGLRPVAHAGFECDYIDNIKVNYADNKYGRGPAGCAVRHGQLQCVHDTQTDPHFLPWRKKAAECGFHSVISLPLKDANARVFAVLSIYAKETHAYDEAAMKLLQELANDLAFGILSLRTRDERDHYLQENLKSDIRYKQMLVDTIRAMSLTVEKRDPYTAGHQNKVAQLSVAIGQALGMDEDRLEGLRLGATIHDIGKIYVPSEILNRPGRLSKAEFEMIKSHAEVGYDIIKDVHFPWPVADMVIQHHERMDGSGYPRGLKGDEIILEARILTVADVVEAITSHRPYRAAKGMENAIKEIEANRGKLYDDKVVEICLHLIRDEGFTFSEREVR